jgi:hypothetical protein
MTRRGAEVARWAHNPKVAGSIPAGANLPFAILLVAYLLLLFSSLAGAQTIYWNGAITTAGSDCTVATQCFIVTDLRAVPSLGVSVDVGTSGLFWFEATIDGANWFSVQDDVTSATTAAADGVFYFTNPGWRSFRVRASALNGIATLSASKGNANLRSTATIAGAVAVQGTPAVTSDAAAWPVKVVFGNAQIDPRDTSDRAGRLLGQVTFSAPQHIVCDSGCSGTSLGQATMASSLPVTVASDQSAIQVSGTFWATAVALPSAARLSDGGSFYDARQIRALTSADHITCDNCGAASLGQTTMANSAPVVIASNQSAVPVSGTFWQTTQPVSGTFWQSTQPVSLSSLPALAAGSAVIGHVIVDTAPTTAVTGTFWQTTQPVSGPLTDTQIRATPLPVSGTVSANISGSISNTSFTANAGTNLNTSALALESGGNLASILSAVTGVATAARQDTENASLATLAATVTTAGASTTTAIAIQGDANALPVRMTMGPGLPLQPCNPVRRTNCAPKGY